MSHKHVGLDIVAFHSSIASCCLCMRCLVQLPLHVQQVVIVMVIVGGRHVPQGAQRAMNWQLQAQLGVYAAKALLGGAPVVR